MSVFCKRKVLGLVQDRVPLRRAIGHPTSDSSVSEGTPPSCSKPVSPWEGTYESGSTSVDDGCLRRS